MRNYSIGRPSRKQAGSHRIRFAKSGKTVTANGAITLLELAEQSGITIGHECRAGNCGECMVKCLKGDIEMTNQAEIDIIDRKKAGFMPVVPTRFQMSCWIFDETARNKSVRIKANRYVPII